MGRKYPLRLVLEAPRSGVELNVLTTVSRLVCLGAGSPFGAHDQNLHVL
jgi:hypothetical protein